MPRRIDFKAPLIESVKTEVKPLPEQVADRLTQLIIDEAYLPGHKLPNEYILAQRLGVGRSTVREAIKILASRNVLGVRHGSGTFVSERIGIVDDPLGFRFHKDKRKLALDLCDVRLLLEPAIAASAAENRTDMQVEAMQRYCVEIEKQFEEDVDHSEADVALHRTIAESSGNLIAPGIVGIISTAIPLFVSVTRRTLREETITSHSRCVDAIRRRNPTAAKRAMRDHLEYNRANFLKIDPSKLEQW